MKPNIDSHLFDQEVYVIVQAIPPGRVASYGQIANWIGWPQHSRRVGKALSKIPQTWQIPSHRVVNSQGELVPHWVAQRKLLEDEGVTFTRNGRVKLRAHQWNLDHEDPF